MFDYSFHVFSLPHACVSYCVCLLVYFTLCCCVCCVYAFIFPSSCFFFLTSACVRLCAFSVPLCLTLSVPASLTFSGFVCQCAFVFSL